MKDQSVTLVCYISCPCLKKLSRGYLKHPIRVNQEEEEEKSKPSYLYLSFTEFGIIP